MNDQTKQDDDPGDCSQPRQEYHPLPYPIVAVQQGEAKMMADKSSSIGGIFRLDAESTLQASAEGDRSATAMHGNRAGVTPLEAVVPLGFTAEEIQDIAVGGKSAGELVDLMVDEESAPNRLGGKFVRYRNSYGSRASLEAPILLGGLPEALPTGASVSRRIARQQRNSAPGAYPIGLATNDSDLEARMAAAAAAATAAAEASNRNRATAANTSAGELVEALPVREGQASDHMMEAQPMGAIHQNESDNKFLLYKRVGVGCVILAILALTATLSWGLSEQGDPLESTAPTTIPVRPLPPMGNLSILYNNLPDRTKESLYDTSTPQYLAWQWLLSHPNIADVEEWRKKQIYAMATIFYSLQGPYWPESNRIRWMNTTSSACSWVWNDAEIEYYGHRTVTLFGPDAYDPDDYFACNEEGKIQSIGLFEIWFGSNMTIETTIPPEIQLLTSLKILSLVSGQFKTSLSNIMVPALAQLPNLEFMSFAAGSLSGTIPKQIAELTSLRHLVIPYNELSGTIPTVIARISSLEFITLFDNGLTGMIPTQLGLMTSLTRLELSINPLTGPIPSELGLLSNNKQLLLKNNDLTGTIPSELALLTSATDIRLGDNVLSGSIPEGLWSLSNIRLLHLPNLPDLHGRIPSDMMMPKLTSLILSGSTLLSGTLPDKICAIEELEFDCTGFLCGCGCPCTGAVNHTDLDARANSTQN